MLDAGYPLSAVTAALADRWQPGVTVLPMSDQRVETHVVVDRPGHRPPAGDPLPGVVGAAPGRPRPVGLRPGRRGRRPARPPAWPRRSPPPTPSCWRRPTRWCRSARSSACPACARRCWRSPARIAGVSPIVGGAVVRGMADRCLPVLGIEVSAEGVGRHYGARAAGGLLDAWLVAPGRRGRRARRRRPPGAAADDLPRGDRRPGPRRAGRRRCLSSPGPGHLGPPGARAARVRPRRRPRRGDRGRRALAGRRRRRRRHLQGRVQGRGPAGATSRPAPTARPLRLQAVEDEAVRVVARRGPLAIVQTRQGWVVAAAGIDASNVGAGRPRAPARGRRRLGPRAARPGCASCSGVDVAVVVSDTFGRTWREGLTDVAVGSAGIAALIDHRGAVDAYGNRLETTRIGAGRRARLGRRPGEGQARRRPGRRRPRPRRRPARSPTPAPGPLVRLPADDLFPYGARDLVGSRAPGADLVPRAGELDGRRRGVPGRQRRAAGVPRGAALRRRGRRRGRRPPHRRRDARRRRSTSARCSARRSCSCTRRAGRPAGSRSARRRHLTRRAAVARHPAGLTRPVR